MTKFMTVDADGQPAAFFSGDIHGARTRPVYGDAPELTEDDPAPQRPVIGEEPNPDTLIPVDAIEITDDQWQEFLSNQGRRRWDGENVVAYDPPPPPITPADVDAERDRRISAGFDFQGVRYQSRPEDRENMAGASTAALAAMMNGAQPGNLRWHGGDGDFVWIAEDNSLNPMDAQTVFALGQAAMAHKQAMIFAARAIKDASPIANDFADASRWP